MKKLLWVVALSLVLVVGGCSTFADQKPNVHIIKPDANKPAPTEIMVENIASYEDVRAGDFGHDHTLLVSKENKDVPPVDVEGTKMPAVNLYLYDTVKKTDQLLFGESAFDANAQYSPDKQHIYYTQTNEGVGGAVIIGRDGTHQVMSTNKEIEYSEGKWINNQEVLYADHLGDIYLFDVTGHETLLLNEKIDVLDPMLINNQLYYLHNGELRVYDLTSKQKRTLKSNVLHFIASPDQHQLALVEQTSDGNQELVITDLQGKQKTKIVTGTKIDGVSWSPDSSLVSYGINAQQQVQGGLFLFSTLSLKSTPLSVDLGTMVDCITWNDTGKKLLFTVMKPHNGSTGGFMFVTYVVTFK